MAGADPPEGRSTRSSKRKEAVSELSPATPSQVALAAGAGVRLPNGEQPAGVANSGAAEDANGGTNGRASKRRKAGAQRVEEVEIAPVGAQGDDIEAQGGAEDVPAAAEGERDGIQRFRTQWQEIARRRAAHFAHFAEDGELDEQAEQQAGEDPEAQWPGPFAEARRLARGRAAARAAREEGAPKEQKRASTQVRWTPARAGRRAARAVEVPSLFELCVRLVVGEIEEVESLAFLPDLLRRRVSSVLCSRRKMSTHSVALLLEGRPVEVSAFDCTLITQEQLISAFCGSDTLAGLEELDLGMCGRCFTDTTISAVLKAKGEEGRMPALTRLGLRGAYLLSDAGLGQLLEAAPALTSVELSQCSLLTAAGIHTLVASHGPRLRELSLSGCQQLSVRQLCPSLVELNAVQRLCLSGAGEVDEESVVTLVSALGRNLVELRLGQCSGLTDAAVGIISDGCPQLQVLDLDELPGLTDASLESLSRSKARLHKLQLKRARVGDEALASFISAAGACLASLSLNAVVEVGDATIVALAKHAEHSLSFLDISFCRLVSDQALGLLADACSRLSRLRCYGCSQLTPLFLHGHSNEGLVIMGVGDEVQ